MGKLVELSRPITRKASRMHRGRHYVVTLLPGDVIEFRELWGRSGFDAPLASIFDHVVRWHVRNRPGKKAKRS